MIPKLDWRRFSEASDTEGFVADLSAALRGPGLLRLSHHGIAPDLISETFQAATAVFDLTEAEKRTLSMRAGPNNRGWARLGAERLADGSTVLERREAFNIGLELPVDDPRVVSRQPFRTQTPWPSLPRFRETMLGYFDAVLALGVALHRAIATDLGLPKNHFESFLADPLATLRLVNYPPGTGRDGETGAGVHTDYGSISLLMTDDEPGLQAQLRNGDWVDVTPDGSSFVVLVGDMMERWTGGVYAATPHRVQTPRCRRQAINFYLDPEPNAAVAPMPGFGEPIERPQTYAAYLADRLARAHGALPG